MTVSYPEQALHTATSSNWYTPPAIVEAARVALGGVIDIDPASSSIANEHVRAVAYYSKHCDGLACHWFGRIYLNPPSPPMPWWKKLVAEHAAGRVRRAVYLAYSIEQLVQAQSHTPGVLGGVATVCILNRRVRFMCTASDALAAIERKVMKGGSLPSASAQKKLAALPPDTLVSGDQPTHGSAVLALGIERDVFAAAFAGLGVVP